MGPSIELENDVLAIDGYQEEVAAVQYESAAVSLIIDWRLHSSDLEDSDQMLNRLLPMIDERITDSSEEVVVAHALWLFAVQRYTGCYAHSARRVRPTPAEVYADHPQELGIHEFFWDLRSKHLVHDVNNFNTMLVPVVLDRAGNVVDVPTVLLMIKPTHDQVNALKRLVGLTKHYVDRCLAEAERHVRSELEMLGPEARLRLPLMRYARPREQDVSHRRS